MPLPTQMNSPVYDGWQDIRDSAHVCALRQGGAIIVNQPVNSAFREDAPHVYAVIQLDERPHTISNVIDCAHDNLKVDMPLVAVFDDITPEWTLVKFKPA